MVEWAALEMQCVRKVTVGSNPTPSAFARRSFSEVGIRFVELRPSDDVVALRRTKSADKVR